MAVESIEGFRLIDAGWDTELDRPVKSNALAFWMNGARTMCRALPFFRLGAPQQPQETSFYVFNRVENGGLSWFQMGTTGLEQRRQAVAAGPSGKLTPPAQNGA